MVFVARSSILLVEVSDDIQRLTPAIHQQPASTDKSLESGPPDHVCIDKRTFLSVLSLFLFVLALMSQRAGRFWTVPDGPRGKNHGNIFGDFFMKEFWWILEDDL